jgi:hypothetical protein
MGRARANINKKSARRRRIKGRWINFFRREVPASEAWIIVGKKRVPDCIPAEERLKYLNIMMGRSSKRRNAQGVAKVMILSAISVQHSVVSY